MKYFLTPIAALCCFVGIVSSQTAKNAPEKCKIEIADAPKPGGYFLRQSLSDVMTLARSHRLAFQQVSISGPMVLIPGVFDMTKATERDSVYSVAWGFYKDKVATLRLQYLAYTPKDLSQFVHDYSTGTNLPEAIFKVTSDHTAEAKCGGFSIHLTTAYRIDERTRQFAEVQILDRKAGNVDGRSDFENRIRETKRQREELRRNPRKMIDPGGPVVGRSN